MKTHFLTVLVLMSAIFFVGCKESSISITNLTCEYLTDPQGIDVTEPQLSWKLESVQRGQKQTAYRLLVASSPEKLMENTGDLWDTEKVRSDQSIHVAYKGKKLESRMPCYWKIRIWDKDGKASNWSEPAEWSMGLLTPDDWKAKWIGTPEPATAPYFRHPFNVNNMPERATIYIAALGYFELFINGQKVGNEVLAPAVSNYSKRSYYRTYDVSSYLKKGPNS
jgi:alpha-L-rhamnosidase